MEKNQTLVDVQSSKDERNISINRVGIRGVKYPIKIQFEEKILNISAIFDLTVFLPQHLKGTHMSRFIQLLNELQEPITLSNFTSLVPQMLHRLESEEGTIRIFFDYFRTKKAPVSKVESCLDYQIELRADQSNDRLLSFVKLTIPVLSLCPCSKEISKYGAHNQRSHITIDAEIKNSTSLSFNNLIDIAESSASCELWGLLKRPDEKYVTEKSYENPKFVEDIIRDTAFLLDRTKEVLSYQLEVENFESIHNHSAYAFISKKRG